jgi:hypothetical protein
VSSSLDEVREAAPSSAVTLTAASVQASELRTARRENMQLLLHSKAFLVGMLVTLFWVFCAFFGRFVAPRHEEARRMGHDKWGEPTTKE